MPDEANSVFRRRPSRTNSARQQQTAESTGDSVQQRHAQPPSYPSPNDNRHGTQALDRNLQENLSTNLLQDNIETTLAHWRDRIDALFSDPVTPVRVASHFSVLVVAALILIISRLDMPDWQFSLRALPSNGFLGANLSDDGTRMSALFSEQNASVFNAGESLQRAAVPFTVPNAQPEPMATTAEGAPAGGAPQGVIQKYIVQSGDTVLGIAERFDLRPETIQWANSTLEINPDLIRPGDELNILPVNGVLHTIRAGDTLSTIADRYSVAIDDIIGYSGNGLDGVASSLIVGQELIIPDGTKPQAQAQAVAYTAGQTPSNAQVGSGNFVWPSSGPINQRYWSGHPAIDVGGWTGSPVRSADGGYVAVARGGWNGGYGNHVIIDHGNGFVTLYAHLNSIFVTPGESVSRGQQVGSVGNTGNSSGPHLHFEIRYQGVARNPLTYLP